MEMLQMTLQGLMPDKKIILLSCATLRISLSVIAEKPDYFGIFHKDVLQTFQR
jgi:hypothetical protein